jgi:alanine racemase
MDIDAVRVEIDLDAIVANARDVQAQVGPETGVLAVLKGDAYGHGAVEVGRALERDGTVTALVVTSLEDGFGLRASGVTLPIITVPCRYGKSHDAVLGAALTPVISTVEDLEAFARAAWSRATCAAVHVEIDTGMSRLGLRPEAISGFLRVAAARPEILVTGLCTHLASADCPSVAEADRQLDAFDRAQAIFWDAGHRPAMVHAANTAAIFRMPRAHFTHVRAGIALFGGDEPSGVRLRPAMRVVTRVAQLRSIRAGEAVSYGGSWVATRPSRIATLAVGYAHGYPRRLSSGAQVLVRGRRCPVVGSVCMEMTMVDVTDLRDVCVDDEAVLLGRDGADEIRAPELARTMGGIVEEFFCGVPRSLTRHYLGPASSRSRREPVREVRRERTSEGPLS